MMTILATGSSKTSAFTLLELVFVVVIIVILTTFTALNLRGRMVDFQLWDTAGRMQGQMNYLRERAIIEAKPIQLVFDRNRGVYRASFMDNQTSLFEYVFPAGFSLEWRRKQDWDDTVEKIVFYPDGRIDKLSMRINSPTKKSVIITTEATFGQVKIIQEE